MPQYNLNNLSLFSNVRITRDYSVVHDMVPGTWYKYLTNTFADSDPNKAVRAADTSPPVQLYSKSIDYYRLPQTIRIQANYDTIRKATYGVLVCVDATLASMNVPSFRYLFFWVDSVRLVKQTAEVTGTSPNRTSEDVVELDITPDAWSNKFSDAELYDSFILRRHEIRWTRDHSDPDDPDAWVYHPRYFPNAADDVGGAYEPDGDPQDLTEPLDVSGEIPGWTDPLDLRFIVVSYLDQSGKLQFLIGATAVAQTGGNEVTIYTDYNNGKKLFSLDTLMSGALFTAANITASYVQSITVTPYIEAIKGAIHGAFVGGIAYLYLNDTYIPFSQGFEVASNGTISWIKAKTEVWRLANALYSFHQGTVDPAAPEWDYVGSNPLKVQYQDKNEPMMHRAPARIRRVTSGMGGKIVEVPDIDAFRDTYTCQNMFELNQSIVIVFGGGLIEKANALGNIGTIVGASLPIFSSAWMEYQAIQKAGDDISYNAQQVSTAVGMFTGAGAGAIGGAIAGAEAGPAGAAAGAIGGAAGGVIGGITKMWSNSENLRAKHETIKNSPCTVVSGGSGLGAYIKDYIDIHYQVMKLDTVSLEKLRTQYYYFGYNVNMVDSGTVSTKTRKYFDYIETRGAKIRGDLNAEEASQIAAIFDKGVRIYHDPQGYVMIGAGMSMENAERVFEE